jgi:hypothetical protein
MRVPESVDEGDYPSIVPRRGYRVSRTPCVRSFLVVLAVLAAPAAFASSFTGVVKSFEGAPAIVRDGVSQAAAKGARVQKGDRIKTGPKGAIGIVFSDDTVMSMGPDTEIVIDEYQFEPIDGQLSFVVKIVRGTISYLSGQIAKLAPKSVRMSMPTGTIGVRGTHLLICVP